MARRKSIGAAKRVLSCVLAVVLSFWCVPASAFAEQGNQLIAGAIEAQATGDGDYVVNFDVGPYDAEEEGAMGSYKTFTTLISADPTSKMGAYDPDASLESQYFEYYDGEFLPEIEDTLFVVGYQFTTWAVMVPDGSAALNMGVPDAADTDEVLGSLAQQFGGEINLSGAWEPFEGYRVLFVSKDGGNDVIATRGKEGAFLNWNSNIDEPVAGELALIANDSSSNIYELYKAGSDDDPAIVAERSKVRWFTKPGGPSTTGTLEWTGGKFYTTVTSGSMTDAEAVAADKAVRAAESTVTLYPYYAPETVAVEYYGNGSDNDPAPAALSAPSQSIARTKSEAVKAPVNLKRNNGKSDFVGWSTVPNRTADEFKSGAYRPGNTTGNAVTDYDPAAGDKISVTLSTEDPVKLYAVWQDKYTVKYEASDDDVDSGSKADKTITSTSATGLLPNVVMKDKVGYEKSGTVGGKTAGWYVKGSDGNPTAAVVTAADTFQTLYDCSGNTDGTVTLMFAYAPKQYKVVYDWNGGYAKGTTTAAEAYTKTDQLWDEAIAAPPAEELAKVERPGYVLDGWTLSDGSTSLGTSTYGQHSATDNASGDASKELTVKAHWKSLNATVTYTPLKPTGASHSIEGAAKTVDKDKNGADLLVGGTVTLPSATDYTLEGWTLSSWAPGTVNETTGAITLGTSVGNAGTDWTVGSLATELYTEWTANTYTIAVSGGTPSATTATYDSTEITFTHTGTVPTGYSFAGWATAENVHSTSHASFLQPLSGSPTDSAAKYKNLTATNNATANVYPVYVPDDIEVTLSVKNPATGDVTTSKVTHPADSNDVSLSAPPNVQGYVFKGWYSGENGTGDFYGTKAGESKTDATKAYDGTLDGGTSAVQGGKTTWPTAGVTLHACFTEMDSFAISFINNTSHKDGSGNPTTTPDTRQNVKWTDDIVLPSGPAVDGKAADGYTFKGWYKLSDLDNGTPKDNAVPIATGKMKYKDIVSALGLTDITATAPDSPTLYAGWVADPAKVKLEGGEFTAKNGETRTPTVAETGAGGNAGDTEYELGTKVGANPALTNPFAVDGYTFKYWKLGEGNDAKYYDENGAEVDSDGNAVTGGKAYTANATDNAANKLVAQWQPVTYTLKFEDGSGKTSGTTIELTYDEYKDVSLPDATLFQKDGYTLKGWKDVTTGTEYEPSDTLTGNLRTKEVDAILQAQWVADVTYEFTVGEGTLVSGTDLPAKLQVPSGEEWTLKSDQGVPAGLTRAGYTSDGWTDGANDYKVGGTYNAPAATAPQTVTLYPKWTPLAASVVVSYGDGQTTDVTYETDNEGKALVTGAQINLPTAPTRPGYTFMGWSTNDDNSIDQLAGDVPASATTYTVPAGKPSHLYAVWQAGGVVVKFNGNGATSGSMADQTNLVVGAETGTLNANAFVREGYSFDGWALSASGAKAYEDVQAFSSTVKVPAPSADGEPIELFALWEPKSYTITFKPNGADGNPADGTQVVKADESPATLAGPDYTRTGYELDGWSTSSSRTSYATGDWRNGDRYTLDLSEAAGANTLYAIWKPKDGVTYTIERYKQNLAGTGWDKVDASTQDAVVGEQTGTTGQTVSIAGESAAVYEGFTLDPSVTNVTIDSKSVSTNLSGAVAADGSLVLRAFYTRNAHSVSYKLSDETTSTPSGFTLPAGKAGEKYGADETVSTEPATIPAGWTFTGWTTTDATVTAGAFTMPDKDVVFTGTWTLSEYAVTFAIADTPSSYSGATGTGSLADVPSDMKVAHGQKMSAEQKDDVQKIKVTPPAKDGDNGQAYYQTGWQKKVGDGSWTPCGDPWDEEITAATVFAPVFKATYAVVYKPGIGGDFQDDEHASLAPEASFPAFAGTTETIESVATPKAKTGFVFAGWKVEDADVETGFTSLFTKGQTYTLDQVKALVDDTSKKVNGNYTLTAQWTRAAHTLNLDFDGGKVDADITVVAADANAPSSDVKLSKGGPSFGEVNVGAGLPVNLPSLSKDGYTFNGWKVTSTNSSNMSDPVGMNAVFDMPNENLALKAQWIENPAASVTITYRSANLDEGTVSVSKQVVDASTGSVKSQEPAADPTPGTLGSTAEPKWGYKFASWTLVGSAEPLDSAAALVPAKPEGGFVDATYEASFAKETYGVTFEKVTDGVNIGSGRSIDLKELTDEDMKVKYLESLPKGKAKATTAADSGYKCVGWLYEMTVDGTTKKNDASSALADPGDLVIEGPVKFWPAWVASKADITYNLNDPAVANAQDNTTFAEKAEVDAAYTVKGIDAVSMTAPAGYTFKGWAETPSGDVKYSAEAIADTGNPAKIAKVLPEGHTLYAKWEANTVTITYKPGNHAAQGASDKTDSTFHAGDKVDLKAADDTSIGINPADGYAFAGWLAEDGTLYLDGSASQKTAIDPLPGEGMTLTAQWSLADSDIVYNANGGHMKDPKQTEMRIPSAALLDVIAWTKYTVEHGASGGEPIFMREGYTFSTWNEKEGGDGTPHAPGSRFPMPAKGGVELFAQWVGNAATVTLNAGADNAVFSGDRASITYTGVTDQTITATDKPARDGYGFRGWSHEKGSLVPDDGLADGDSGVELTLGRLDAQADYADAAELYAVWVQDGAHVVTVSGEGVTGGSLEGAGTYEVADGKGLPATVKATPAEGFVLDGWYVGEELVSETDPTKLAITDDCAVKPHFKVAPADKSALAAAISAAQAAERGVATSADGKDVDPSNKWTTPAEKAALDSAIASAQAVYANANATQAQVNAARSAVAAAQATYDAAKKAGTKSTPVPTPADKSALAAAISAAQAAERGVATSADGKDVDPSDKWTTPAEKAALDSAIASAQAVYANANATQAQVNAARSAVAAAQATYDAAKKAGTKSSSPSTDPQVEPTVETQTMWRLYNPYSGEHLYTAGADERDFLASIGWNFEGIAWIAPTSGIPVYRLYNPYSGDHHYTTSADERDWLDSIGWNAEGIGWYSTDDTGAPLYRMYNPYLTVGTHHYTLGADERDFLSSIGWSYEGIGWYGVAM